MLTIGFLTFNRLKYFKATFESFLPLILEKKLRTIVLDNLSSEPGYREYLNQLRDIGPKIEVLEVQSTHAEAMNIIVEKCSTDYLMLWPDDMQLLTNEDWVSGLCDILEQDPEVGSLSVNFLRSQTVKSLINPPLISKDRIYQLFSRQTIKGAKFKKTLNGLSYIKLGTAWPPVCPSGIPAIHRVSLLKKIGIWESGEQVSLLDSSLGAEDRYRKKSNKYAKRNEQAILCAPIALDIVTDQFGGKARVRGGKRYGNYPDPPKEIEPFYYPRFSYWERIKGNSFVITAEDICSTLDIDIPRDENFAILKASEIDLKNVQDI